MEQERGSVIVVVATDAPLLSPALTRLATRAGLGLARTGSVAGHGSGDIFLAFSTGVRVPRGSAGALWTAELLDDEYLDPFFGAVVDATEAAILDALFRADTVTGRAGHVVPGLPVDRTLALLRAGGRISA
jgi:D-aminopeptidase